MTARRAEWWKMTLGSFILLGAGGFFPLIVSAQSPSPTSASALNQQQRTGRRLFMQNCSYCHLPRNRNPKSTEQGSAFGGDLKGLFRGQGAMTDQAVQAFVQQGLPGKMPGFQYGLKPEEIESIIAYLKAQ